MGGRRVDVRTPDGTLDTYVFQPEGTGQWPAVIFYMDAFGIRPQLDQMAERLASSGYIVAVPNLYYRSGAFAPFDPKQVFAEGPERMRFRSMIDSIDGTKMMSDTRALIDVLDADPGVRSGNMGAVGYCMGGGMHSARLERFRRASRRRRRFTAGRWPPTGRTAPICSRRRCEADCTSAWPRSIRASLVSSRSGWKTP